MRIFYKPFALVAGVISARVGKSVFKSVWSKIDEIEPPAATTKEASLPKVVGAAALEAATMASIAAAVNRGSARAFHYLTGIWPEKRSKKSEED